MYWVYIIECKDGRLYTGIARDVQVRFGLHANGRGARFTRANKPARLVYTERKRTRSGALKREYAIKQLSRAEKLVLIGFAKRQK
jgi:putative endonuclease